MNIIFWTGYSKKERIQSIHEIEAIVNKFGFITDFKQFSDISLSIQIDIDEQKIEHLHHALFEILNLDESEVPHSTSNNERVIFLNITFSNATGDLRIEVPAVPG